MPPQKTPPPSVSRKTNIAIGGDVNGNVIVGDNNTVNQTIIQKFFNIFKSDAETVDQRNRRIMLGHVENFWVKGILEKSLHGAALLDLGIKEDPDALTYPWTIKREANKETLPAGTSMLEIFQEIGMGRSLLILGAPGAGKTTMLLELTRQLIERAREDVIEPIPVVFNLSSWTEKLTLADWLTRELNIIYTIPKKVAPTWIKENKMLLLLDGLDEVRQESRDKCVDAINQFRKENGLTSMAVCSRIQDYAELKARLSFDGAIEIQPLTSMQVNNYFNRFGKGLAGIRQVLEKDTVLREMAETPLFLSIMTLAYRDTKSTDILLSENLEVQRKHLFDTYIERMFERPERSKNERFKKQDILHWLSWLAYTMAENNIVLFLFENIQPCWLSQKRQRAYKFIANLIIGLIIGLSIEPVWGPFTIPIWGPIFGIAIVLILGPIGGGIGVALTGGLNKIEMVDTVTWSLKQVKQKLRSGLIYGLIVGLVAVLINWQKSGLGVGLSSGLFCMLIIGLSNGLSVKQISQTSYPGQRISSSIKNSFFALLLADLFVGLIWLISKKSEGLVNLMFLGLSGGLAFGGFAIIQNYTLRTIIAINNLLPFRLIPFLEYCTDLIFLRRVGGGYIFVHRLLMEHFAAMYPEQT